MNRAAIYTRVSSDKQETDGSSLGTQLAACRACASERGYQIIGEFTDTHTGAQYRERPGLSKLRELLRTGAVDVVVVHALDRLSRDQTHTAVLVDEIEHHGARLDLVTESFDDSPTGKLIRSVQAFASEVERTKIIERSVRGRKARLDAGKMLPGPKPKYGYRWADAEKVALEIDELEAIIVRRIYRAARNGSPLRRIATGLSADGVPAPKGGAVWHLSTVRHILSDPSYTGAAYGWRWDKATMHRRDVEDAVALPDGTIPAIVSGDMFAAVQERLGRNKAMSGRRNPHPEASLLRTGFIHCAVCGRTMHVNNSGARGKGVYRCIENGHKISIVRDHIDAKVWERVRWLLLSDEALEHAPEGGNLPDPTPELDGIERSLAGIERQRSALVMSVAKSEDADTVNALTARLDELSKRRRELIAERDALNAEVERYRVSQEIVDGFDAWRRKVAATLDVMDWGERRELLSVLGIQVKVWPVTVKPRVRITSTVIPSILNTTA